MYPSFGGDVMIHGTVTTVTRYAPKLKFLKQSHYGRIDGWLNASLVAGKWEVFRMNRAAIFVNYDPPGKFKTDSSSNGSHPIDSD